MPYVSVFYIGLARNIPEAEQKSQRCGDNQNKSHRAKKLHIGDDVACERCTCFKHNEHYHL